MKAGVALVDVLTGKDATIGILAALTARARTGKGDFLEVSLLTSSLAALVNQGQASLQTGIAPAGMANRHPSIAPYETFHTADGPMAIACGNDGQFVRLSAELGVPELAEDERFATSHQRVAHREALFTVLEQYLRTDTADSWVSRLNAVQVPAGKVNNILEAIDMATDLGLEPLVSVGPEHTAQIRHPVIWTDYRTAEPTPPPLLGEHDQPIRDWLQSPANDHDDQR